MNLIFSVLGYLVVHLVVYVIWYRHVPKLRTEAAILAYHVLSYGFLLGVLTLAGAMLGQPGWIAALFAGGLHGIYSLSFLELWSLTQGSYSLGILARIAQNGGQASGQELATLQGIGATKQAERRGALHRLGLTQLDGAPTFRGRLAAVPLRAILWLSNGRPLN
jgi:hypothetical protein